MPTWHNRRSFTNKWPLAAGFDKVFEIGPVFRANPSMTSRHDTEFTSVDVEISWINSHEDVMSFEERWIRYVLEVVKTQYGDAIKQTFGGRNSDSRTPIPAHTDDGSLRDYLHFRPYNRPWGQGRPGPRRRAPVSMPTSKRSAATSLCLSQTTPQPYDRSITCVTRETPV